LVCDSYVPGRCEMPQQTRSIPQLLLIYVGVLGTLILGCGYALTKAASVSEELALGNAPSPSILDERIATARAIKSALARPQPRIEPLPPITAKVANPRSSQVASTNKPKKLKLSPEARDAMAMDGGWDSQSSKSPDRAGNNGW